MSSVYSHHTYQSIPEHQQHHIYHTLEPTLAQQQLQQQQQLVQRLQQQQQDGKPPNAVYINRNLDLITKNEEEEKQVLSDSDSLHEEEDEEVRIIQSNFQLPALKLHLCFLFCNMPLTLSFFAPFSAGYCPGRRSGGGQFGRGESCPPSSHSSSFG